MKPILPKHLNPVVVSPNIILSWRTSTFGISFLALPDFFDYRLSNVVEFFNMSSMWNFRKFIMIPNMIRFKMNASTIVIADT